MIFFPNGIIQYYHNQHKEFQLIFEQCQYNNCNWIKSYYPLVCTAMGPAGFYGTLNISETKYDTITLFNETGKFKLRFRFIIDNDSLDFDSNEFTINGLEL